MKLVTIKRNSDGMPYRLTRIQAQQLMLDKPGEFYYTSKSAAKAFNKRFAQTVANQEYFKKENIDFSTNQNKNFVEQEGNKIIAWVHKGFKTHHFEVPKDETAAEEKKDWLHKLVDKYCINPNDQSIKAGLLSKLAIFFGFLKQKEAKTTLPNSVDLPLYTRHTYGYGQVTDLANVKLA